MDEVVRKKGPGQREDKALDDGMPTPRKLDEVLAGVHASPSEIHGFLPLWESLDWRLARSYWKSAGLSSFVRGEVPYLVNNTGRLSEHAAAVLFEACLERHDPTRPIVLVELGAGTGLFARYLLDAFQSICEDQKRTFYDQVMFFVTDDSAKTVAQWQRHGLFEAHAEHVCLCTCDAQSPATLRAVEGDRSVDAGIDNAMAVFCNYVLDVLPVTLVRERGGVIEEAYLRSLICEERPAPAADPWTREEIISLADPDRTVEGERMALLRGAFDVEMHFRPAREPIASLAREAFGWGAPRERFLLNIGALEALGAWLPRLDPGGFALINDYGGSGLEAGRQCSPQHFGSSLACGLNFTWLDRSLEARGYAVHAPENDDERAVRARLVARANWKAPSEAFQNRFSIEAERHLDQPALDARAHAASGRKNEALDAYRVALDRSARDFRLIGEIAEFVGLELGDYSSGRELAQGALARNPWLSPWLYNVLGDCLFCERQFGPAHEAYRSAQAIDPADPRTNLNLAYTLTERGEFSEALQAIARGLSSDASGKYRSRLLEKQNQILSVLRGRRTVEETRMLSRLGRLR
jgi:tetratricopeptide (TPR) repeat protein